MRALKWIAGLLACLCAWLGVVAYRSMDSHRARMAEHAQAAKKARDRVLGQAQNLLRAGTTNLEVGASIYRTKCKRCHEVDGLAPDLRGSLPALPASVDLPSYVLESVVFPSAVVRESGWQSTMWSYFAEELGPEGIADVVSFVVEMARRTNLEGK